MSNTMHNNPPTPSKLDHARAWLFRFARNHRTQPFTFDDDLWRAATVDVCLSSGGNLRLLSATNGGGPVLLLLNTPRRDAVVCQDGAPVNLIQWLFEGITKPLTPIYYSPRSNTLGIGLAVESLDWSDPDEHVSDLMELLFEYLWEVSSCIEQIRTESSLHAPMALQIRQHLQASIVGYPVVTNTIA